MTPLPLPEDLNAQFQSLAQDGFEALQKRNFRRAVSRFKNLYELLKREQPTDGRYHKGLPLHNWGIALLSSRQPKGALEPILLAYVEDALTQEQGEEDLADQTPAGQVVIQAYQVRPEIVSSIKQKVRDAKKAESLISDPAPLLAEVLEALREREERLIVEAPILKLFIWY